MNVVSRTLAGYSEIFGLGYGIWYGTNNEIACAYQVVWGIRDTIYTNS
jgi:hypothetical protein